MTNEAMAPVATAELTERGLSVLRFKVEKLNKRAKRHGMVALDLRIVSAEPFERKLRGGAIVPDTKYCVEILGCEPCINGWRLAAKIEYNDLVGQIVHIAPGRDDNGSYERYRTVDPICEHCNTNRRRKDVFVLENGSGTRKLIGRNCLADYLRNGSADDLARWAEFANCIAEIDSDGGDDDSEFNDYRGCNGNPAMPLESYLRIVAVVKRSFGWMGRTAARDRGDCTATADIAGRLIYGRGKVHDEWVERNNLVPSDGDDDYAAKAAAWAAALESDGGNEYWYTIGQIGRAGVVDMRKLDGYAASILIAYDKHCEREIEYADRKKSARNKAWFGDKGKREKGISVTCKGLHSFEGHYGVTTIVRLEHYPNDADKAIIVWFASGDRYDDWEPETEYTIDATVKDHTDDDKYGKQTKVNRVKQL